MLEPGFKSSESRKSLGIVTACGFFIYYILSKKYNMPDIDVLLANAGNAVEIAQAYAESAKTSVAKDAFDSGTIIALLIGMYKTTTNYNDGRITLKKEDMRQKAVEDNTVRYIQQPQVRRYVPPQVPVEMVQKIRREDLKKF